MPFRIIHDKGACIGCGACASVCPENWVMDGDKSKPKKTQVKEMGCNQEAVDSCPVHCITIKKV